MEQQAIADITCPKGCSVRPSKSGKRPDGTQRYRCGACYSTFSASKEQENLFATKQAVDDTKALLALQLLVEGNSIRSTERITGLHRDTITGLLLKAGERSQALMTRLIRNVPVTDVQVDEIWGFVGMKETTRRKREVKNFSNIGDAWTFIAIDRPTKLVLTYQLGKRTMDYTQAFMRKLAIAASANQKFQLTSDGWKTYAYAVGTQLWDRVDYAQLVKIYSQPTLEEQRRYSPGNVVETKKTDIYGEPDFDLICTSHIERQNGSLRQWCKRLTRLTYAFSKRWENLDAALAFAITYYNLCRVHRTIRQTPAMAAGLTDHVWSLSELLENGSKAMNN